LPSSIEARRALVEPEHGGLSVRRQCAVLGLPRSTCYYAAVPESEEDLCLKRLIDEEYLRHPFFGSRNMTEYLQRLQYDVNRKRVQRLMREMGIQAIYPKKTTVPAVGHKIYPYLLRGVSIVRTNQVWSTDITYVPMRRGFMYLTAIMDWHSRYVLSWQVSNTMDTAFCLKALEEALGRWAAPEIFNTDQGSQFTSEAFTGRLAAAGIAISMDGRGRALDNVFVERLWRTVKYENIYLKDYATVDELIVGLTEYFTFYDEERFHQSLGMRTPWEVYQEGLAA
jgi:putative transposase